MEIYVLSLLFLLSMSFMGRWNGLLSPAFIFGFCNFRYYVGGDYQAYIDRGKLALQQPELFFPNEMPTLILGHLESLTAIPTPNLYTVVIFALFWWTFRSSKNQFIWLTFFAFFAVPIGVGYLRQASACALILAGLKRKSWGKLFFYAAATLFHPAALFFACVDAVSQFFGNKRKLIQATAISVLCLAICYYYSDAIQHYFRSYANNLSGDSKGAGYRLLFYSLIGLILVRGKTPLQSATNKMFLLVIGTSILLYFSVGSTAADRIAVFVTPIILLRIASLKKVENKIFACAASCIYFLLWFSYSPNAHENWQYRTLFDKQTEINSNAALR